MAKLTEKKCVPCEGGTSPLAPAEIQNLIQELQNTWDVIDNKKIKHEFTFKDFKAAMKFVNAVADLSEKEGHHPDITIHYNKVLIELWTHAIGGLSENDFIVAVKIDEL